jgi:membrane protease YdiL (CAAX protease family)
MPYETACCIELKENKMKQIITGAKKSVNIAVWMLIPLIIAMSAAFLMNKDMNIVTGVMKMPLILSGVLLACYKIEKENVLKVKKSALPDIGLLIACFIFSASAAFQFKAVFDCNGPINGKPFIVLVVIPVTEELLFRYIMTELIKDGKVRRSIPAALITSLCWAVFRYHYGYNVICIFLSGILLSYIYQKKNSVWYGIAVRAGISAASAMMLADVLVTSNIPLITINMFILILSFRMLYYNLKPTILVKPEAVCNFNEESLQFCKSTDCSRSVTVKV